jgi:hypothetical protein
MAWLEIHTVLIRHRKIKKFARKLKIAPVVAVGHLTTLWSNVLELAEDGDITKWTIEDISEYGGWEGEPKAFYEALKNDKDGFIDEVGGKKLVHDWFDYAGKYLTSKYRTNAPDKLNYIKNLYIRLTKDGLNTDFSQPTYLTNLPNLPNLPSKGGISDDSIKNLLGFYKELQGWGQVGASFYQRNYNVAKVLIKEAGGLDLAKEAMKWWAGVSEKNNLSWTIETVIKKWAEFMKHKDTPDILKRWEKKK